MYYFYFLITGDGLGNLNYAHFVIEGKISLIYRLKKIYNSVTNLGKISAKSNKIIKYSHKYLEICTFSSNACFNIGNEIIQHLKIITQTLLKLYS